MYHEIDRKFLIEEMPRLTGRRPVLHERYFLQYGDLVEERIQKVGDTFEYEIKTAISPQERTREKKIITKKIFNTLKKKASKVILRESYLLSKKPRISINRYLGEYKGFSFAEVEFDTREDSEIFEPLSWMGTEITNSPLGRDSWLLGLDREHFLKILDTENRKLNPEM
jgi:CYTH domain-containing protein